MSVLRRTAGILPFLTVALGWGAARADIATFRGADAGAGPGMAHANADRSASQFAAAAASLGATHVIDFENSALSRNAPGANDSAIALGQGVTAIPRGTDVRPPRGYSFGISNGPEDALYGFNTTPGVAGG